MPNRRDTQAYLRALQETAHTFSGALQEPEVVQALLTQVGAVLPTPGVTVHLLSPDGEEFLLAGAQGLSEAHLDKRPLRVAESRLGQRVLAGEVVVIADVTRESDFSYPQAAVSESVRGVAAVPLSVRGRTVGVLQVYMNNTDTLSPEDLLLLDTLADLGALALEKVRLQQSLYRIAEVLSASLELRPMLQQVLEATVKQLGLKAASIRLLDPKRQILLLMATYGLSDAYLAKGEVQVTKSPLDQRVLRGEVVVLHDAEHEPGLQYPAEVAREGIRSVLVVPLILKERTLGVVRVYSAQPRDFGPVARNFLVSVADLVALAMENAELFAALRARHQDLELDLVEWRRFLTLG
ncbi:MAG: GAF domain-containing protein [Candidatus Binatia bacterium]